MLLLCCLLFVLVGSTPTQIKYPVGTQLNYNLTANIDGRGHIVTGGTTYGTTSTMTSVVAMKCVKQQSSTSWLVVMNMFNTMVGVGQGDGNDLEFTALTTNSEPLGDDMYFEHSFDGTIPTIWYEKGDSPILVQIKASAINAFQTHVVAPEATKTVQFSDPGGKYDANVNGGAPSSLFQITKSFDSASFLQFSDPSVKKANVQLSGLTKTTVADVGYVHSSTVGQTVVMSNMNPSSSSKSAAFQTNSGEAGFDSHLGSSGVLNVNFLGTSNDDVFGSVTDVPTNYSRDTLFGSTVSLISQVVAGSFDIDPESQAQNALSDAVTRLSHGSAHLAIKLFSQHSELLYIMTPYVEKLSTFEIEQQDMLFYILSSIESPTSTSKSSSLLIEFGLKSPSTTTRLHALLSTSFVASEPSDSLLDTVWSIFEDASDPNRRVAAITFGTILPKIESKVRWNTRVNTVLSAMNSALDLNDDVIIPLLFGAINAEIKVTSELFTKLKNSQIVNVQEIISMYSHQLNNDIVIIKNDPSFPYSKDIAKNWTVGGKVVSATLSAELYAGTNFDCNHEYFNYKVLAQVIGFASVLGLDKDFLVARAIYGQENGQPLDNELFLQIFGKILYEKKIPSMDCIQHSYQLYHSEPGFALSYILWVSIIPVKFSLNVDLVLNAEWDWQVCLSKLSAMVELVPAAELKVSGDVNLDLLIIRGGVSLEADFGPVEIIPQAKVDGSECEVIFDVLMKIPKPITAKFYAYYQFKKCKFLIFDCHWDVNHQKDFWSWSSPAVTKTLYEKTWKIAGGK